MLKSSAQGRIRPKFCGGQDPRSKSQTITNNQETNFKFSGKHAFWNLNIGDWNLLGHCILPACRQGRVVRYFCCSLMLVFWMLVSAPTVYAISSDAGGFQEANTAYRTGDYAKAVTLYEKLIQGSPKTAVLYYNLGNAYMRLEKLSAAILNYEKALRLDPRNADIHHNLNYARGLREYRVEDTRNWYLKVTDSVLRMVTQREMDTIVLILAFIFLVSAIIYFLSGRGVFWNPVRKFIALILVLGILAAVGKHVQGNLMADAIIMNKECEARYGPSEHDQVAFRMGEGIKVFVMDRREDWSRVLLLNGESGWVKAADIAEVKEST